MESTKAPPTAALAFSKSGGDCQRAGQQDHRFSPAGQTVSVPVVFLRDHEVLLVLYPGVATDGARLGWINVCSYSDPSISTRLSSAAGE